MVVEILNGEGGKILFVVEDITSVELRTKDNLDNEVYTLSVYTKQACIYVNFNKDRSVADNGYSTLKSSIEELHRFNSIREEMNKLIDEKIKAH